MSYPIQLPPARLPVNLDEMPIKELKKGEAFLIPVEQLTLHGIYSTKAVGGAILMRFNRLGRKARTRKTVAGLWVERIA